MKLELTKELKHSIQLKKALLSSVSIEKLDKYGENDKVEPLKVLIDTKVLSLEETCGKAYVEVELYQKDSIKINVGYEGEFLVEKPQKIKDGELKFFLEIQSIPLLMSYIRETVNSIFDKMGLDYTMPVLDMSVIYSKYDSNKEENND